METPITTRAAVLLALRDGPGFGRELIRRVRDRSRGHVRLSKARVYPVLKALERQRLVLATTMSPRRQRGGRSRTYYDLTAAGVGASRETAEGLAALVGGVPRPAPSTAAERKRMAARIMEADALAESAAELAGARRPGGRGR